MTKRNLFRIAILAAAAAYVGYVQLKPADKAPVHRETTATAATAPVPPRRLGSLAFQPCVLAQKGSTLTVEAQCTQMDVPEDAAHPTGRKIQLAIAWVPAKNEDATDPVFMLAGGPGQSALDTYPVVASAFDPILKKRNVILVDQRGTGKSNPLACKDTKGDKTALEEQDASINDPDTVRRMTEQCRDALSRRADLRFYTTSDATRDLDAVRAAIGADKIDLVGISYGTRVAQHYARRYPSHTRALVLDSVAPNELVFGNDFARNLDDALALGFRECAKVPHCVERMGDPRKNLADLLAALGAHPQPVDYRDPMTGEMKHETLTRGHLSMLVRMYAYEPVAASTLPLTLAEAGKGRYAPLMSQVEMIGDNLGDAMTAGMQLSVICAEDADDMRADPAYADSVLGNQMIALLQSQCAIWPHGKRPSDFHAPLVSDVPILVLEGEFDPVTPPRYGEQVVKHLSHGRLLVLKGQGHNVIGVGCTPKLVARFLDTADAKSLDAGCLDKLPYTPPFTSFSGWEP